MTFRHSVYPAAILPLGRIAFLALAAALASGCTTSLRSDPVEDNNAGGGLLYALPKKDLEIDLTWEIGECRNADNGVKIDYTLSAEVRERLYPDPDARFVLRYEDLNAATKVTETKVSLLANGTLASINAKIDDRTGEVVGNTVAGIASIARAIALPGTKTKQLVDSDADKKSRQSVCSESSSVQFQTLQVHRKELEALERQTPDRAKADARLQLAKSNLGRVRDELRRLQAKDANATPGELKEAQAAEEAAMKALAEARAARDALGDDLREAFKAEILRLRAARTFKFTQRVTPGERNQWSVSLPAKAIALLLEGEPDPEEIPVAEISIKPLGAKSSGAPPAELAAEGIVYRLPATAHLTIAAKADGATAGPVVLDILVVVPQLGTFAALDLRNGVFDNNRIEAAFTADGGVTSLTFASDAQAERASAAFAKTAESALSAVKAARKDAREQTVEDLKAQRDALQLAADIEKTRAGIPNQDQAAIDQLRSRKTQLELELEIQQLQQQLEKLKAPKN